MIRTIIFNVDGPITIFDEPSNFIGIEYRIVYNSLTW